MQEDIIKDKLESRFDYLKGAVSVPRISRLSVDLRKENLNEVLDYFIHELGFKKLYTITGLDLGDSLELIYHLDSGRNLIINVKVRLERENPHINAVIPYFLNADIYERELVDLLGVNVDGLPKGNRYPLPDNWPQGQYPLRKDWPLPDKISQGGV